MDLGNPTTWKDGKTSSMRIASLKVDDQNGSELDISVTTFPGDVGGLLANVNRWVGQIELSPVKPIITRKILHSVHNSGKFRSFHRGLWRKGSSSCWSIIFGKRILVLQTFR